MIASMSLMMVILAGLAVIIAILWILMPFAIFGTKPILRDLLEQQRKTNDLLEQLLRRDRGNASTDFSPRS